MAKMQLALNRQVLLTPLLLGLVVQLYRWWLKLRRQVKRVAQPAGAPPVQAALTNSWPERRDAKLSPPPRPGFDSDERMTQLADDPRYFEGAELGKAQKAALGQTGLVGTNTVSFDPSSTLVRPLLRVLHGCDAECYEAQFKLDDVILVPDFGCLEDDRRVYDKLLDEIRSTELAGGEDPRKLPMCTQMVSKMCTYFGMPEQDCTVSLSLHKAGQDPAVFQGRVAASAGFDCAVSLCFGAPGELHCESAGPRDALHLPCTNGHLVLVARDVELEWQQPQLEESQGLGSFDGQLLITVSGPSAMLVDHESLAPKKVAANSGMPSSYSGASEAGYRRPSMRIMTVRPSLRYRKPVSHDDVIIVPDFFCAGDDWNVYYQLLQEMRESQSQGEKRAEWLSWHEGAHLLTKNPEGSKTFHQILDRLKEYFGILENGETATRFNWYRDGSDWKPFHHDSAAFNAQRAMAQNCTIGISFGATRELAFRRAKNGELVYFPQTNGMLFFFGRDANIRWQHAINALPLEEQHEKGRISIILWGLCSKTFEEEGSPPMLQQGNGGKGNSKGSGPSRNYPGAEQATETCRNFQRGRCTFGDRCRYSHGPVHNNGRKW